MKVEIRVIPKARENKILSLRSRTLSTLRSDKVEKDKDILKVYVTAVPEKGKANEAVIVLLAKHFGVAKSKIKIIKGEASRWKIVEITN